MENSDVGDGEHIFVCADCIGDDVLKGDADESDQTCSYCGKPGNCMTLANLADRIHEVIESQFNLTSSNPSGVDYALAKEGLWERPGELVADVIADVASIESDIAEDVRAVLSEVHGYSAIKDGEEDPYADDAQYEERGPDDQNFRDTWESFCQQLRWRTRFFSQYADIDLNNIFGDLDGLRTHADIPVIKIIGPTDAERYVFRGRIGFTQTELETILKHPARELGAPPPRLARAGRMNAAGISVFYGAQDASTCVAELRAPVGSSIVVGRFEIIREVRLLDLDALAAVYFEVSRFDPNYGTLQARAAFLQHLVQMISRPVMPSDETFEYIPTQVISEYLGTRVSPPLDGMLFRSSQTGGQGRNLVLFNHASVAEPDAIEPGTQVEVWMRGGSEDDPDPFISVFEEAPPEKPTEPEEVETVFGVALIPPKWPSPESNDLAWLAAHEPTLRVDVQSLTVETVRAVSYECSSRTVLRHRVKGKQRAEAASSEMPEI